jgi:hypothetical protein
LSIHPNNPHSADLHRGVFAARIGEFVGKVIAGKRPECTRLPDALWAFEKKTAVGLCSGAETRAMAKASHGSVPCLPLQSTLRSIQPAIHSIAVEAWQIRHRMEWAIASGSLHCLPVTSTETSTHCFSEPFCREATLVICRFTFWHDAPRRESRVEPVERGIGVDREPLPQRVHRTLRIPASSPTDVPAISARNDRLPPVRSERFRHIRIDRQATRRTRVSTSPTDVLSSP